MARPPTVLEIVIALCVAAELFVLVGDLSGLGPSRGAVVSGFALFPGRPQPADIVTSAFLHAGPLHLGMNMLFLAAVGRPLEARCGSLRMAAIYAAGTLSSAAGILLLAGSAAPVVGASGAIFGVFGASVGTVLRDRHRDGLPLHPVGRSLGVFALLNVAFALLVPVIAWQAHLGGFVGGVLTGLALWTPPPPGARRAQLIF